MSGSGNHQASSDLPELVPPREAHSQSEWMVVGASSLGTMFEWYDFFLYGSLATHIGSHFFSSVNETSAFIFALAAFAAGFLVRPFGALVFGSIGDVVGRKSTFLITMGIMGLATFVVGLLPGFARIGMTAPIVLVALRLLQGLALGGEYGGAAVYVAEHAPPGRRGFYTSWINAMATAGLLLSLVVIMGTRATMTTEAFAAWGWRIPFLASALLLGISLWIRLRLEESPVFRRMKAEASLSKAPLSEAFGNWSNVKLVLVALFGAVVGTSVVWYTGQFYALFFLERVLRVESLIANELVTLALSIAAPSYVFFGWLSDWVGRKTVLLAAYALALFTFFPAFHWLTAAANPRLARAQKTAPVVVRADPGACSFQFDPLGGNAFDERSCDIAKSFLSRAGVGYGTEPLGAGLAAEVVVGAHVVRAPELGAVPRADRAVVVNAFRSEVRAVLDAAGYPASADAAEIDRPLVVAIVAFLAIVAAMGYAPLAALFVELFPARIRYTSLSLPYHIGTGWVGGMLPTTAFAVVAATGDIYSGLWYPTAFAGLSLVVGSLALPETNGRPIDP